MKLSSGFKILFFLVFLLSHKAFAGQLIIKAEEQEQHAISIQVNKTSLPWEAENTAFVDGVSGSVEVAVASSAAPVRRIDLSLAENQVAEVRLSMAPDGTMRESISYSTIGEQSESQEYGYVAGVVKSAFEDNALPDAAVRLSGYAESFSTNEDGQFLIRTPRGIHSLVITHPEHKETRTEKIAVFSGERTLLDIVLPMRGDTSNTEEVTVFGFAVGEPEFSSEMEREAVTVMDILSEDDLKRTGDSNVAGLIQRVTGVSVVDSKFAVVRGLAGRYISSTLDGGLLPSTDFLRRDVPLDLFPSAILGGIQIEKSYRPELPGDTTGGLIGMLAKGVPDEKVNELSISIGWNSEVYGKDTLTYDGGDRDWLGLDDGTRELPSVIDDATDFGRESLPSVCPPPPLTIPGCVPPQELASFGKSLPNIYAVDSEDGSFGYGFSYGYGNRFPMSSGEFGFYAALDYSRDAEFRNQAEKEHLTREGGNGFLLTERELYSRASNKVDVTGYAVFGYESDSMWQWDSKTFWLRKTSDVVRSSATQDLAEGKLFEDTVLQWTEQELLAEKLSGEVEWGEAGQHTLDGHVGIARSSRYEPDKREYTYENGVLVPSRMFRKYSMLEEDSVDFGLDYQWQMEGASIFYPTFKAGVYGVRKERAFESARFGFTIDSSVDRSLPVESIMIEANFDADLVRLRSQGLTTDYFDSTDDMDAVYISSETDIGNDFSLLLGGRMEQATQTVVYPQGNPSDAITPLETDDVLPAAMVTWRVLENLQIRTGYSKTLSRPGLVERSNTQFYDPDTDEKIIGNPNLINSEIDNFDLRFEYYFSEEENVTLAAFHKDIKDPIEKTVPEGVREGYTFRNSQAATLSGVELDAKKIFVDNGSLYFFVAGNISYIDSEVSLDDDTARLEGIQGRPRQHRSLQGQSEHLANLQFGFDHFDYGHSLTLLVNHFGDRINRVDNVSRGDEIEQGRTLLDVIYRYEMENGLAFKFKVHNLLDEEIVFKSEGERQISAESYKDGMDVAFSVSASF